jgi:antirestriction protein ArdC
MSQMPEQKKNRFAISREVQSEFVTNVAKAMNGLADKIRGGDVPAPASVPYCPATGFSYAGANQTRLMLETMVRGYNDDRWLTFSQLQRLKDDNKDLNVKIRKGQHGVALLRAEDVHFSVGDDGKWTFYGEDEAKKLRQQGGDAPRVQRKTLFYPYTVFNASQIEGFPPKEEQAPAMSAKERNDMIENFIACTGVKVEHDNDKTAYDPASDTIKIPAPAKFKSVDEYLSTKLRLAFHATGHNDRENRNVVDDSMTEVMRGETFSILAGARFGLPMPLDGGAWPEKFEGADNKKAFEAAAAASRILSAMEQFSHGDQPNARWFPKQEEWPALSAANEEVMRQVTPPVEQAQPAPAKKMRMR